MAIDAKKTALLNSPATLSQVLEASNRTWDPMSEQTLPFDSPHVQTSGFTYGAPPVDDSNVNYYSLQNNYCPIGTVTMGLKVTGPQITLGIFPQAQRIASVLFQSNAGMLSADLIAAFNNQSNDGELGVFLCQDVGATIGLGTTSSLYDGILAPQGFFSKRSGVSFSLDIAPLIKANTSLALYAVGYGSNLATSYLTVSCIIRYASLDG